jgi:hypothetical protein
MNAYTNGCIDPRFLDFGTTVSGQFHAPVVLSRGKAPLFIGNQAGCAPKAGLDEMEE